MKIAIVHDWFVNYMGSEKCVESFVNIYKDADVFGLVDFLNDYERSIIVKGKKINTTFIQKLPFAKKAYRNYLPLYPFAVEQHDLNNYDVIVSSSHSVAKGVSTNHNQLHICYCHTPMRYAWDLYHQYIKESNLEKGVKGWLAKYFLHKIRIWDYSSANRVDYFLANSKYIARRIKKVYNRDAEVIYPPVDVNKFEFTGSKDDYYLIVARFVPYKKVDRVVEAFSKMPDKKLKVIGSGPDEQKVKKHASANIEFMGYCSDEVMVKTMQNARAFIYAAEEDFGITIVEAQGAGTPVIAYGAGGACETVIDGKTGILFKEQTCESLIDAVKYFELHEREFDNTFIYQHAQQFSRENFEKNIRNFVESKCKDFFRAQVL